MSIHEQESHTGQSRYMEARGFSSTQIATVQAQATRAVYQGPAQCTNVAIDEIEVKQQKTHPECPTTPATEPNASSKRPKVINTVARIDQGRRHFTLSGSGAG